MMSERGVDIPDSAISGDGLSAHATICVDSDGERSSVTFPGVFANDPTWLPLEDLVNVRAVLVDHRWLQGAERLLCAAAARGIPRILDADLGAPEVVRRLTPLANHAIFARGALVEFSGHDDPEAGLRAVAREDSDVVAVTLGDAGSLFRIRGEIYHVPTLTISASDTTGAGDVFHGAYALAVAEGFEILEAARFATAAAALKAINGRSWDGMPDRQAVFNLLKEKW
jgi:sulfofructose kinase